MIGVDQSFISRLENNAKVTVDDDVIPKLCLALNTTYEYLFEGKGVANRLSDEELNELLAENESAISKMSKKEIAEEYKRVRKQFDDMVEQLRNLVDVKE